jgi:predicted regulator of Ras-like GTPase activity (Roadblock/LC7/MglB family)
MDAAQALADLAEVSSQIEGAVLVGADGTLLASTFADEARGGRVAERALDLVNGASDSGVGGDRAELTQVLVELPGGAVFVARDAERLVAAVTGPDPTVGLVFYDLKTCLRLTSEGQPREPARGRRNAAAQREATGTGPKESANPDGDA